MPIPPTSPYSSRHQDLTQEEVKSLVEGAVEQAEALPPEAPRTKGATVGGLIAIVSIAAIWATILFQYLSRE